MAGVEAFGKCAIEEEVGKGPEGANEHEAEGDVLEGEFKAL